MKIKKSQIVARLINTMVQEIKSDYIIANKKSIID